MAPSERRSPSTPTARSRSSRRSRSRRRPIGRRSGAREASTSTGREGDSERSLAVAFRTVGRRERDGPSPASSGRRPRRSQPTSHPRARPRAPEGRNVTHVYAFDHPHGVDVEELKALLGGKGASLAIMTGRLGMPVPPGFTISTAACGAYLAYGWPADLEDEIRRHLARLEATVGRRFGDADDPLLVSVRSGGPASMPGMLDTILNLGLNDATTLGLARATGDPEFAEACRNRFRASYPEIVGVDLVPEDPWEQLRDAVEAVFRSWNGDRARAYRAHEGIADTPGTGVNVQAMVFGNRGPDSATGV